MNFSARSRRLDRGDEAVTSYEGLLRLDLDDSTTASGALLLHMRSGRRQRALQALACSGRVPEPRLAERVLIVVCLMIDD